jgi:hypothetical protein
MVFRISARRASKFIALEVLGEKPNTTTTRSFEGMINIR